MMNVYKIFCSVTLIVSKFKIEGHDESHCTEEADAQGIDHNYGNMVLVVFESGRGCRPADQSVE